MSPPAPAVQPERPEARLQELRNQDRYETPVQQTGPELRPGANRPQVNFDGERVELTQTTPNGGGGTTTRRATTNGSDATASVRTERPGQGSLEGSVTASDDGLRVQGTRTDPAGGTRTGSVTVNPEGNSVTLRGATQQPNGGGGGNVTATIGAEQVSLGGSRTERGITRQGNVSVTGEGVSASAGGSVQLPRGLSFEFNASGSRSTRTRSENGFTTTTVEGEVSLRGGARLEAGGVSLSGNRTDRSQTRFEVRLRNADQVRVQAGQIPQPNPYNPESLPEGGSILMRDREFSTTNVGAGYRGVEAEAGRTRENGQSLLVERTGPNTVRLTAGPEQALENRFRLGVSAGPVSVGLTATDRVEDSTMRRAEFDLSTEEGRTAYNAALASRQLPQQNGPGVSNVETVQQVQARSTRELSAALGPLSGSITNSNELDQTITTRPDGSSDRTTRLNYGSAVPVTLEQSFRPDGTEDASRQRFTLRMPGADPVSAAYLQEAFTGNAPAAQQGRQAPRDVEISFTPDQARQLQERVRAHIASFGNNWHPISASDHLLQNIVQAQGPAQVAVAIGRGFAGSGALAELFAGVYASTGQPLPGTLNAPPRS